MKNLSILLIISLLANGSLSAQEYGCGAVATISEIQFMDSQTIPNRPSGIITEDFPIVVYVIKKSSNSNNPVSETTVQNELNNINLKFNEAGINFILHSFETFIDDTLSNHIRNHSNQRYWYPYYPNVINLMYVDTILTFNMNTQLFENKPDGYSPFPATASPPNNYADDRIFIQYSENENGINPSSDNKTLGHELGHFFGLFHTHEDTECLWSGNPETSEACSGVDCGLDLVHLSINCDSTGDRCCDTPIDPKLQPSNDIINCQVEAGCNSSSFPGILINNIMSYYPVNCSDFNNGDLTSDQLDRLYHFSNNGREYISNNNQSQLLTLLSPSYGTFDGFRPRDVHFFYGDSQFFPLNISCRAIGGPWIDIDTDVPVDIGYNIYQSTYTPLFYGSGTNMYEFRIEYAANNLIYDIGAPITVNSINSNPNIDLNINLAINCTDCMQDSLQLISWNSSTIPSPTTVDLLHTINGGVTWEIISTNEPNTGIYSWAIPSFDRCQNIDNVSIALQYESSPGVPVFDVIDGFVVIESPVIDLENGLVAYYPFNGNANDESGNGHHGIVNGATLTNDRFGNDSSAYEFDGLDDFINATFDWSNVLTPPEKFSISGWFKFSNLGANNQFIIAGAPGGGPDNYISKGANGKIISRIYGGTPVNSDIMYADGLWHNFILSHNGVESKFIIDGINQMNSPSIGIYNRDILWFGARENGVNGPQFYDGYIDDIRIYDRSLNCNEIDSLYTEGCTSYNLVQNQTINLDTTIYALDLIELNNVTVNSPFELILKSTEVLIENNCQVSQGAKLEVINEAGCFDN